MKISLQAIVYILRQHFPKEAIHIEHLPRKHTIKISFESDCENDIIYDMEDMNVEYADTIFAKLLDNTQKFVSEKSKNDSLFSQEQYEKEKGESGGQKFV